MGYTIPFNSREEFNTFLNEKKEYYKSNYDIWLKDYASDNRIYIANEDKYITLEELAGDSYDQ